VSFTVEDSLRAALRSGEALEDVAAWALNEAAVSAVLLNCAAPQALSSALPQLARHLCGVLLLPAPLQQLAVGVCVAQKFLVLW
jgi:S-methylmethionine-dependent homocysteine/selenocysteine methylase